MLSKENNELITRTNKGTPGGELLRRYWQPVALSAELKEDPVSVTIMGEELVLFRDENGQPALIDRRCPHRGTDLSYGRVEGGGIRCLYHGWCMNSKGDCIDQPAEPEGSKYKESIHVSAYPCREVCGVILTYMGPGEPPLIPNYMWMDAPPERVHVGKMYHECNYLQGVDGEIDPAHLSFVHAFEDPNEEIAFAGGIKYFTGSVSPVLEVEETDFGVRVHAKRPAGEGKAFLRVTNFVYPNFGAIGGFHENSVLINWHVPIDDYTHWKFFINVKFDRPYTEDERNQLDRSLFSELDAEYKPKRNARNRYLQNREIMKTFSFSGIGDTPGSGVSEQDLFVCETQGAIQDRSQEHLGYGDKAIALSHHLLLKAIKLMEEGKEVPHVVFDPDQNNFDHLVLVSELIEDNDQWTEFWKNKVPAKT